MSFELWSLSFHFALGLENCVARVARNYHQEVLQIGTLHGESCRDRGQFLGRSREPEWEMAHGEQASTCGPCYIRKRGWEWKFQRLAIYPKWNWLNSFEWATWSLVSQHWAREGGPRRKRRVPWDNMKKSFCTFRGSWYSASAQRGLRSKVVKMQQFLPIRWKEGPVDCCLPRTTLTSLHAAKYVSFWSSRGLHSVPFPSALAMMAAIVKYFLFHFCI